MKTSSVFCLSWSEEKYVLFDILALFTFVQISESLLLFGMQHKHSWSASFLVLGKKEGVEVKIGKNFFSDLFYLSPLFRWTFENCRKTLQREQSGKWHCTSRSDLRWMWRRGSRSALQVRHLRRLRFVRRVWEQGHARATQHDADQDPRTFPTHRECTLLTSNFIVKNSWNWLADISFWECSSSVQKGRAPFSCYAAIEQ